MSPTLDTNIWKQDEGSVYRGLEKGSVYSLSPCLFWELAAAKKMKQNLDCSVDYFLFLYYSIHIDIKWHKVRPNVHNPPNPEQEHDSQIWLTEQ